MPITVLRLLERQSYILSPYRQLKWRVEKNCGPYQVAAVAPDFAGFLSAPVSWPATLHFA
jgi:hypothetical protein